MNDLTRKVAEPGFSPGDRADGAVAQLGEHLLCKQGVSGSIPLSSTKSIGVETDGKCLLKKKSLHRLRSDACSAYIVKRRLIWRLPGVGFWPDVRAQFC